MSTCRNHVDRRWRAGGPAGRRLIGWCPMGARGWRMRVPTQPFFLLPGRFRESAYDVCWLRQRSLSHSAVPQMPWPPTSYRPACYFLFAKGLNRSSEAFLLLLSGSECFSMSLSISDCPASALRPPPIQRGAPHYGTRVQSSISYRGVPENVAAACYCLGGTCPTRRATRAVPAGPNRNRAHPPGGPPLAHRPHQINTRDG